LVLLLFSAVFLLSLPSTGMAMQQIGWRDLTISVDPREDPLFALDFEARKDVEELLLLERLRAGGNDISKNTEQRLAEIHAELAASGVNAEVLLKKERAFRAKIVAQRSQVRLEWDNAEIRIPGYLLPLEYEGEQIIEFLLVPYVGACIHTPPPPANQIIYVRSNQSYPVDGLFTPVWVTGKLSVESSQQSVGLSDGVSEFEVGYTMHATEVVEYRQ